MSTRIELEQKRSVTSKGKYRVVTSVVYAQTIDSNVFVHNVDTGAFSHVAFPYDMLEYPDSAEAAALSGSLYYRDAVADVLYDEVTLATSAAAYTLTRVNWLVDQYTETLDVFIGESEHDYVS